MSPFQKKEVKSVPNKDGGVSLQVPDNASVKVGEPVAKPTLLDAAFDPFSKFKTDEEKYEYRALNIRPQNMRVRQAEGWETIEGSDFGDLILGQLPKEEYNRRIAREEQKTRARTHAAVDQFRAEADRMGVKTFEE